MSASTDDTLPMTPLSQRYTVRRRYTVNHFHIPVPLTSDDNIIEIPMSQRIRTESPIQSPPPGVASRRLATLHRSKSSANVSFHGNYSPPILMSHRRSTEDATLSNVAGASTTQLATVPVSPQNMLAYAKKWQDYFERMLSNRNGLRKDVALMIAKLGGITCRLEATNATAY
ncbi:hypothetical protein FGIG_01672 [Fasciola gigantica]|uniref:Uncharacterized protein n=1 Tax=Fasciola gigantica TaxID=46835 RepID=A0A504YP86_FASGI|nr:hypothetical protein FGIG_01672 [Fasciola gigantica]